MGISSGGQGPHRGAPVARASTESGKAVRCGVDLWFLSLAASRRRAVKIGGASCRRRSAIQHDAGVEQGGPRQVGARLAMGPAAERDDSDAVRQLGETAGGDGSDREQSMGRPTAYATFRICAVGPAVFRATVLRFGPISALRASPPRRSGDRGSVRRRSEARVGALIVSASEAALVASCTSSRSL